MAEYYVKEVVKPNFLTMGVEREKFKPPIKNKKKKLKRRTNKKKRLLSKPKAKMPSTNPKKFITKGSEHYGLVKEGRVGFFKLEEMEDRIEWI